VVDNPDPNEPQQDGNNGDSETRLPNNIDDARWFRRRDASFWTAWATILIFATTAIYTYYAMRQWSVMRDQLRQMTLQLPALQAAANGTLEGAHTAASQFTVMRGQLDEMQRQSNAIATQMRPWVALGQACVTTEREYPSVVSNGIIPNTGCGDFQLFATMYEKKTIEPVKWWTTPIQTGQTPALHTKVTANWCISSNPEDNPPTLNNCRGEAKPIESEVAPIIPGEHTGWQLEDTIRNLTMEQIGEIAAKNPTKRFYIVGRITYNEPINNVPHWTTFCRYYSPHYPWPLKICKGGNDMDKQQRTKRNPCEDPKLPCLLGNPN
jgi:hypothetical protein